MSEPDGARRMTRSRPASGVRVRRRVASATPSSAAEAARRAAVYSARACASAVAAASSCAMPNTDAGTSDAVATAKTV